MEMWHLAFIEQDCVQLRGCMRTESADQSALRAATVSATTRCTGRSQQRARPQAPRWQLRTRNLVSTSPTIKGIIDNRVRQVVGSPALLVAYQNNDSVPGLELAAARDGHTGPSGP